MEKVLWIVFHRLARYPGVDEKDLKTLLTGNELPSIPAIPDEGSGLNASIDGGNEEGVFSVTLSGSSFAASTRVSTCCGSERSGNSCAFALSSS